MVPFLLRRNVFIYLKHYRNEKDNVFILSEGGNFSLDQRRMPIGLLEDLDKKKKYWLFNIKGIVLDHDKLDFKNLPSGG